MAKNINAGLIPVVPVRGDGRYAPGTRVPIKTWTVQEDLAIWPLLLACESERAYLRTCVVLCDWLDRVPRFSDPHPTQSAIVAKSVGVIDWRLVTGALGGRIPELESVLLWIGNTSRTGLPLTWAEKCRILRPYHEKPANDEPRVPVRVLRRFLMRTDEDERSIVAHLQTLAGKPPAEPEDFSVPCPVDGIVVRKLFAAVVGADLDDEVGLTRSHAALCDFANGLRGDGR